MRHWETVWSFATARFRVVAEVTECLDDPADSFDFPNDIESVRSGRVAWFDARVRVLLTDGTEIGADYLGACAYERPEDLFRHHAGLTKRLRQLRGRTDTKSKRERKEIRKVLTNNLLSNPPVVYCEYGPGMVLQACANARRNLANWSNIRLRNAA